MMLCRLALSVPGALALAGGWAFTAAQQARDTASHQVTTRDLIGAIQLIDVQIAPDGKRVLYEVRRTQWEHNRYVTELWLVRRTEQAHPIRLLVSTPTTSAYKSLKARWSPDSRRIAYFSDRGGSSQIWTLDPETRVTQPLTRVAKWQSVDPRGVQPAFFRWSPDSRAIAFAASWSVPPDPARDLTIAKRGQSVGVDWTKGNMWPGQRMMTNATVWLAETGSKRVRRLTDDSLHVSDLAWSPDGTRIVLSATATPEDAPYKTELYLLDVATLAVTPLVAQPGWDDVPEWSPDGKWIAFESQRGNQDWNYSSYMAIVPASGGSPTYLASDVYEETGNWPHRLGWSADSRSIYFTAVQGLGQHLFSAPIDGGRTKRITGGSRYWDRFSLAPAVSAAAFSLQDVATPADLYVANLGTMLSKSALRLTELNPGWQHIEKPFVDTVRWRGKDGEFEIEGIVIKPPSYTPGKRYPLLVFIESGPSPIRASFHLNDPASYPFLEFAARGYVIFAPGSRGRAGYGARYRQAMPERSDFLPGPFGDVMAGIDSLIATGLADSSRMGIMGFSYGGCFTAYAIAHTSRFRAASINEGCANFVRYAFSVAGQRDRVEILVDQAGFGSPWHPDSIRTLVEQSPIYRMDRVRTPTLLEFGIMSLAQPEGTELFGALQRFGVPSKLIVYPRTGHGIEEPVLREDSFRRNLAWFDHWVLGQGPNPVMEEASPNGQSSGH